MNTRVQTTSYKCTLTRFSLVRVLIIMNEKATVSLLVFPVYLSNVIIFYTKNLYYEEFVLWRIRITKNTKNLSYYTFFGALSTSCRKIKLVTHFEELNVIQEKMFIMRMKYLILIDTNNNRIRLHIRNTVKNTYMQMSRSYSLILYNV